MAVLPPDPVFNLRSSEMGPINSICFHQNERLLAGTAKGSVHLWDLQTNRSPLHFEASKSNPITSLHHSDENLISQEKGGTVKCWSVTNSGYVLKETLVGNHPAFCRTQFIPEKDLLCIPQNKNEICLVGVDDFQIQQTLKPDISSTPVGTVSCFKFININEQYFVIAGYESGNIFMWDLKTSKVISQEQFQDCPLSIDYDPITNRGICGGPTDKLEVFSLQRQTYKIDKKQDICIKNAGINCIRIRADQKVFVSGGWDSRIRIFSWKSLRLLAVLTEHKTGSVMDIAYSTAKVSMWNAPIMAAGGTDGQVTLWDLYN